MGLLFTPLKQAGKGGPHRRLRVSGLLVIAALVVATTFGLVGVSSGSKVVDGTVGVSGGSLGGDLITIKGVAVNQDGAGGVSAGSVYVSNSGNQRIEQFDADGAFVRAFGYDVVASGQHDVGAGPEVCQAASSPADVCKAGTASAAAGGLSTPQGVAIDQSTGAVYVADQGNRRVSVFSATGTFEGAFGWGVISNATAGLQFCTTATGCVAGLTGGGAGEFAAQVPALAVNPSNGHVLVSQSTNLRVDEFSPTLSSGAVTNMSFVHGFGWGVQTGASQLESCTTATTCRAGLSGGGLGQFGPGGGGTGPLSIDVDSTGAIYVLNNSAGSCTATSACRVQKFNAAGTSPTIFADADLTTTGASTIRAYRLAVDPSNDHVFIAAIVAPGQQAVKEFDSSGTLIDVHPPGGTAATGQPAAVAVDPPNGRLYLANPTTVFRLAEPPAPGVTMTGVTDVGSTTATFHGTVTVPAAGATTAYHFEYSSDGVHWTSFPTTDVQVGDSVPGDYPVSQQVRGLEPNADYSARLVATTGTSATSGTSIFTTDAAAPAVLQTFPADVGQTSATLEALVSPQRLQTTYHFEWGATAAYGQRTPSFDRSIGSGSVPVTAREPIVGLDPGAAYHYRVVATNASGVTYGPDTVFTTLNQIGLPGTRAFELVTPPTAEDGGLSDALFINATQPTFQASSGGDDYLYPRRAAVASSTAGADLRYVAHRADGIWNSSQITPPSLVPTGGFHAGVNPTGTYGYMSNDLSCSVVESYQPLTADTSQKSIAAGVTNLYRRDAEGRYTLLTKELPSNPDLQTGGFGGGLLYAAQYGASSDCERILFRTDYKFLPGASGLYLWDHGSLVDVGVRPDGSVAPEARVGAIDDRDAWNAISDDGSRIFLSATSDDGGDAGKTAIFLRTASGSTTKISASSTATTDQGASYQTAAVDGSHVLFLANYGLTTTTSAGPTTADCTGIAAAAAARACDLYDYDVETGHLTDLSADTSDAGGAEVTAVLGASDDASRVYFAARGQLVAGEGRSSSENLAGNTLNVYLTEGGQRSFVGLVQLSDVFVSQGTSAAMFNTSDSFPTWASRVTPDGKHLLFPSAANVTSYDSGGTRQAYLYSADPDTTVCISCRRDGQAPVGVRRTTNGQAIAPIDSSYTAQVGTSPPRSLSSDGKRVFFTTPDVLAAGAVSGGNNVYQWDEGQISLLATGDAAFRSASDSGDDVFISTTERLTATDTDSVTDVYDARVDGVSPSSPPPAPPCDALAGGCQGTGLMPVVPLLDTIAPGGLNAQPALRTTFSVKSLSSAQRAELVAGKKVSLSVSVNRDVTVRAKGTAPIGSVRRPTVTVISASKAGRAGTVALPVSLSKAARTRIARSGSLKVSLTVSVSTAPETVQHSITFKKAKKSASTKKRTTRRATAYAGSNGKAR